MVEGGPRQKLHVIAHVGKTNATRHNFDVNKTLHVDFTSVKQTLHVEKNSKKTYVCSVVAFVAFLLCSETTILKYNIMGLLHPCLLYLTGNATFATTLHFGGFRGSQTPQKRVKRGVFQDSNQDPNKVFGVFASRQPAWKARKRVLSGFSRAPHTTTTIPLFWAGGAFGGVCG